MGIAWGNFTLWRFVIVCGQLENRTCLNVLIGKSSNRMGHFSWLTFEFPQGYPLDVSNMSDGDVSCTAPATRNASFQILFKPATHVPERGVVLTFRLRNVQRHNACVV